MTSSSTGAHVKDDLDRLKPVTRTRSALSRSPHPYHRRGSAVLSDGTSHKSSEANGVVAQSTSRSESSESGTEADDERGPILRGLPAPPARLHKGLRGASPVGETPFVSPLPTPPHSQKDDTKHYFETTRPEGHQEKDLQEQHRRQVYYRRRRGEIVRRITETLLLGAVAYAVWQGAAKLTKLSLWKHELQAYVFVPACLFTLCPLRRWCSFYTGGWNVAQSFKLAFHIPSRFDPGPLLYPIVLPVLVAISLSHRNDEYLPVNIACGLSSIPASVTSNSSFMWHVRWAITLLPVQVSSVIFSLSGHNTLPPALKLNNPSSIVLEYSSIIFPLHQILVAVLRYLTTTSLDPAELELLSSGLLNLLLFTGTPQAEILKALLWVGGITIFVTCRHLLVWEVALARIPNWKLVRNSKSPKSMLQKADQYLCSLLFSGQATRKSEDSSDTDDNLQHIALQHIAPLRRIQTSKQQPKSRTFSNGSIDHEKHLSEETNGDFNSDHNIHQLSHRRNTFSTLDQSRVVAAEDIKHRKRHRPATSTLYSLTIEQAKARKYLYAGAVYILVAIIILLPIRYYVGTKALSGYEPFGWALGYLFGNIPDFRYQIVSNNLESWIRIPPRPDENSIPEKLVAIEDLRLYLIGPANTRLLLCAYCVVILFIGIITVLQLTSVVEVDTRRKVFHGVMVAMLLPTIFVDPCFFALALGLILAIFLLLDLFRASQLPPVSKPLTTFLAPYVDGRDHRGPVIVSHIFLLIGCAIPLWLSLAGAPRLGTDPWQGWDTPVRDVSMISGVVCVGMGDAAASLIGRRFGRTKWYWGGGKSLEGSVAFAVAVTIGLMFAYTWLRIGGWVIDSDFESQADGIGNVYVQALVKCAIAGCGASLLESVLTAANDNVVVPVGLWLLVRGLEI